LQQNPESIKQILTPTWVSHAVFYQIFPDRFARSPRTKHPKGLQFKAWGSSPEKQGYQGGDLLGIVDNLDYLQDLGVTALSLNPVFTSAANHRYQTYDYYHVDPLLGGDAALRELIDAVHQREMRIILDGVFNHASRGFWPFHHVLENGKDSPYVDWFIIQDWPLRPYNNDENHPANYHAWWGHPPMPTLNSKNEGVREFIFGVAKHWLEFGADGWRLDVPFEIDDDSFWREFRNVVKSTNPDAYIVGEVWENASRWLQGDQFDAVMNYPIAHATIPFFAAETVQSSLTNGHYKFEPSNAQQFTENISEALTRYDWTITRSQLNLLNGHDTPRLRWLVGDDESAIRLCTLLLLTIPGTPCIYYGDEIGLTGADDPYCRAAYPWDNESLQNTDLLQFYKDVITMRHQHEVLRTGTFKHLATEDNVYAFQRQLDNKQAIIALNAGKSAHTISFAQDDQKWQVVWPLSGNAVLETDENTLTLTVPARGAIVLISS
jgi:neopullulanase